MRMREKGREIDRYKDGRIKSEEQQQGEREGDRDDRPRERREATCG